MTIAVYQEGKSLDEVKDLYNQDYIYFLNEINWK